MTIEPLSTASLIPYARNAKKHDASQVAKLAGSIREFGFNNPVLIDKDNGIIAGHGRVMAASKLGLAKVPCIRLAHLTETQKRAYIIADNKLALNAGWDEEMLGLELADLREADFDLELLGFDAEGIEQFLNPPEPTDLMKEWQKAEMPDYDGSPKGQGGTIIVHFATPRDRADFALTLGISISGEAKFCWYPSKPQ
jgi:ParB-like chromosome segregation protein Spo0J